jgi:hypothetical protein
MLGSPVKYSDYTVVPSPSQHLYNISFWNTFEEYTTNLSVPSLQTPGYNPARPIFGFAFDAKGLSLFSVRSLLSKHWLIAILAICAFFYVLSVFSYERSLRHIPKVGYGDSFWGRPAAGFRALIHSDKVIAEGYKQVCVPQF